MKGRCPASGTVVPKELYRPTMRHLATCPACGRVIGVNVSSYSNWEPVYRPHVSSPAPTVHTHRADTGAPR